MAGASEYQPTGTTVSADDIYIEGGPDLWIGDLLQYGPDVNGYYWGVVGTVANPLQKLGCYENFQVQDNLTINEIRCDTVGVVGNITRRNFLEVTFDLEQVLPLEQLKVLLRWSSSLKVPGSDTEYAGIGEINQQDYHIVYFSRIYDTDAGDWVSFTATRVQFEWSGPIQMRYGQPWMVGVRMRCFANADLPSDQRFCTVVRYDPSEV